MEILLFRPFGKGLIQRAFSTFCGSEHSGPVFSWIWITGSLAEPSAFVLLDQVLVEGIVSLIMGKITSLRNIYPGNQGS